MDNPDNRVLELGRLLANVLTQQEIQEIQKTLSWTLPPELMHADETKEES